MQRKKLDSGSKLLDVKIVEKFLEASEVRGKSWMRRSIKRLNDVYECRRGTWIVRGRRELGDAEDVYVVRYEEDKGRFTCTCQQPYKPYAKARRQACTHIGACMLYYLSF